MIQRWFTARLQTGARSAALILVALLFLIGALGSAFAGAGILLAPRIGAANAAFVLAGVMVLLAALLLVIVRALRPKPAPLLTQPDLQRIALAASLRVVNRLSGRQMAFIAAGTMIGLAAFLFGAGSDRKK